MLQVELMSFKPKQKYTQLFSVEVLVVFEKFNNIQKNVWH